MFVGAIVHEKKHEKGEKKNKLGEARRGEEIC